MFKLRLIYALALSVLYGLFYYFIAWQLNFTMEASPSNEHGRVFYVIAGLVLLPVALASFTAVLFDPYAEKPYGTHMLWASLVIFIVFLIVTVLLREGTICIVMALPIILPIYYFSTWLSRYVLGRLNEKRALNTKLQASFAFLPLLFLPIDSVLTSSTSNHLVEDSIVIQAPVETVWQQTIQILKIQDSELPWTFTHDLLGLVKPISAELEGQNTRRLKWHGGISFSEHIVDWQPLHSFAWKFDFGENSHASRIEKHMDLNSDIIALQTGRYRFEPLGDGSTKLTLTTSYKMEVLLSDYFSLWGRRVLSDFHYSVLTVIKGRSEAVSS